LNTKWQKLSESNFNLIHANSGNQSPQICISLPGNEAVITSFHTVSISDQ